MPQHESPPKGGALEENQIADILTVESPGDIGELQPVDGVPEQDAAYSYQLKSGETVYAQSREEAIKMCPELGRLAVEEPDRLDGIMAAQQVVQNAGLGERQPPKSERKHGSGGKPELTSSRALAEQTSQAEASKVAHETEEQARSHIDVAGVALVDAKDAEQPDRKAEDPNETAFPEDIADVGGGINNRAEIDTMLAWEREYSRILQAESAVESSDDLVTEQIVVKPTEAIPRTTKSTTKTAENAPPVVAEEPTTSKRVEIVRPEVKLPIIAKEPTVQAAVIIETSAPSPKKETPLPRAEQVSFVEEKQVAVREISHEAEEASASIGEPVLDQIVDAELTDTVLIDEQDSTAETLSEYPEDEFDIDKFFADLEAGMQSIEAEYIGELLVGILEGIDEPETIEQPALAVAKPATEEGEDPTVSTASEVETTLYHDLETQFDLYLELLEPDKAEATKVVMMELTAALIDSQTKKEEKTEGEIYTIDQQIEELCMQLFEHLGIEYDEETITEYVQSIKQLELHETDDLNTEELSIEALNNLGTHEYKSPGHTSLLSSLMHFIKQKMQPYLMLGRYTLQACIA